MSTSDTESPIHVQHEPDQSRYSATVDGQRAVADYQRQGKVIAFTHTEVPTAIEGRGVASALARKALDDARAAGERVVPSCAFFAHFIQSHPEYADLVASQSRRDAADDGVSSTG